MVNPILISVFMTQKGSPVYVVGALDVKDYPHTLLRYSACTEGAYFVIQCGETSDMQFVNNIWPTKR